MRLSTLLMLFRGKVFVPTIAELRRGDPIEARNLSSDTRSYFDDLPGPDRAWLLNHANENERIIFNHNDTDPRQKARMFLRVWDRELAERRRVWCWHQADIESMALWHIYAKNGVAISTTPARIKDAFDPNSVDTALIARVHYLDDARQEALEHHFMRPYLLKRQCYQHEREVRVILPRDSEDPDGHRLLRLDPRKLIHEMWVSPHIPHSEAVEIRRSLIQAWRNGGAWKEDDDDPGIFVSDAKTFLASDTDCLMLNEAESTGFTNFGSVNMPFVMCGDFCYSAKPKASSTPIANKARRPSAP